ncbi:unnamed protein product [Oikopleura dioica]|uniref:Uncharacterized protein n=1 Tax=Oikopleura dioica TaxID=34765 RepID=E4YN44_OIKDI|nr:unnamed protein product [Oikopleura dioica]
MATPGIEYLACLWAAWSVNAIAVPLSLKSPIPELQYVLGDARPTGLRLKFFQIFFLDIKIFEPFQKALFASDPFKSALNSANNAFSNKFVEPSSHFVPAALQKEYSDPALMIYTSGTTGRPKGALHTCGSLSAQTATLVSDWKYTENDCFIHCLPLHHVHGLVNCLIAPTSVGASLKMLDTFNPAAVLQDLVDEREPRANVLMAVPTVYVKLMEEAEKQGLKKIDLNHMRMVVSGSAAMPKPVNNRWRNLTGRDLLERYGMTEFGMGLSQPLNTELRVGVGVQARVRSDESGEIVCVSGETDSQLEVQGQLEIKSAGLFREYWNLPDKTDEEFTTDGWFKTGDQVRFDGENYHILGRASVDIIKSGGYKISALEIERVMLEHEDIKEIACFAIPDETFGEKIAAVIVTRKEINEENLKKWCKERLAAYKIPRKFIQVEGIEKNAMGKINKKTLKNQFFPEE